MNIFRACKIIGILLRYNLDRQVIPKRFWVLRSISLFNPYSYFSTKQQRAGNIRLAFERLGPIFVKFGQLLSVRRDLLPEDIADELAKLQDQVPPFSGKLAQQMIEHAYQQPIDELFVDFKIQPLAAASIAQVHTAKLHTGEEIIIKILRPHINKTIRQDIRLMYGLARTITRIFKGAHRLRAVELVAEFEHTIVNELDLVREASNATLLRRNFADSTKMYVPKVYWTYSQPHIMVMERIYGVRISDVATLKKHKVDLKKLAEYGVDIFFTQVFRDSFFHADMHPGNLFIDIKDPANPKYLGVDFGIMGALSASDQRYLGENLLAFFQRDYRKVAQLHVDSQWVPAGTRVDHFEAAVRAVCEPIFEKPIEEVSFAQLLLRLLQTARQFNMEVQPQLMLLQKTLMGVEALGRSLYPQLNLWDTAKPFLEKWIRQQKHPKRLLKNMLSQWQPTIEKIIETPSLAYDVLQQLQQHNNARSEQPVVAPTNKKKTFILLGAGIALVGIGVMQLVVPASTHSGWWLTDAGIAVLLLSVFV